MANLTITAANVKLSTQNDETVTLLAGEAVVAGEVVRYDASSRKYLLAEAGGLESEAQASHLVLSDAALDNYFVAVRLGLVAIGATLTLGVVYVLSDTPGKIMPSTDLSTGEYITIIGVPSTTAIMKVSFNATGVVA